MKYIKINKNKIEKEQIAEIVDYLRRSKAIVYPTDTIYGLGAIASDRKAIRKIYAIKGRDKSKALLILASSWNMVKKYCYLSEAQYEWIKKNAGSNRPISVILKSRGVLPKEIEGGQESIAVRVPSDLPKNLFLIRIIKGLGAPIISTSFNLSGEKNLEKVENLDESLFEKKPDLIINCGKLNGKPSTLIDLRNVNNIMVIRK